MRDKPPVVDLLDLATQGNGINSCGKMAVWCLAVDPKAEVTVSNRGAKPGPGPAV
jgi:hypothetical protein